MNDHSILLYMRSGRHIEFPDLADIETAIRELYHEEQLDLSEADLAEHPDTWIEYGFENGDKWSVVTVSVSRTGESRLSIWNDQDDDQPTDELHKPSLSEDEAVQLFLTLAARNIDGVKEQFV